MLAFLHEKYIMYIVQSHFYMNEHSFNTDKAVVATTIFYLKINKRCLRDGKENIEMNECPRKEGRQREEKMFWIEKRKFK